ncbi:universal stress protein, partial [Desulfosporosinus metallidurans]|uniref:universal stress protein n=1 Tax=Desulfosporosinus metallidurans TaxID=1888891 RepID=UPI00147CE30A
MRAQSILEFGHPAGKILETAETLGADMIVLGSRGMHGIERFSWQCVQQSCGPCQMRCSDSP